MHFSGVTEKRRRLRKGVFLETVTRHLPSELDLWRFNNSKLVSQLLTPKTMDKKSRKISSAGDDNCAEIQSSDPVSVRIEDCILVIRGQRVMLDVDLATLYGVTVKRLNEQVKRNKDRFPSDFMFQLGQEEWDSLRSQFATLEPRRGIHRKYLPYAFTEHGVIMLANVLKSKTAVHASIKVVRAFVHLREFAMTHKELTDKINGMEKTYDARFKTLFNAIRQLMLPPDSSKKTLGFKVADNVTKIPEIK